MGLREFLRKRRLERRKRRRKRGSQGPLHQPGKWEQLWNRYAIRCLLVLGMVAIYFLLAPGRDVVGQLDEGDRSPETILAPFDFDYIDQQATDQARDQAARQVRPVFRETRQLRDQRIGLWERVLARACELMSDQALDQTTRVATLKEEFASIQLVPTEWSGVLRNCSDQELRAVVPEAVRAVWKRIVPNDDERDLANVPQRGFDVVLSGGTGVDYLTTEGVLTLAEARQQAEEYISSRSAGPNTSLAVQAARALLVPSLTYDPLTTERRKRQAREGVKPVRVYVAQNEQIVGAGGVVDAEVSSKLQEVYRRQSRGAILPHVGAALLGFLIVFFLARYLHRFYPEYLQSPRFFAVFLFLLVGLLAGARALRFLDARLPESWGNVGLILPVAGLGMIVSALMGSRVALVPVGVAAVLAAEILGNEVELSVLFFISGLVGAYRVVNIRRRTDMYEAGLWASGAALLVYLAFVGVRHPVFSISPTHNQQVALGALWAALSGFVSSILALSFLPLLEDLLGVTTDLKLLEYTAKTDILRDLERHAPGTYQHSLHVANLSESAADAIGANSLVCRVGSLYHDIGKIKKPQYFSENQVTAAEKRIHSKISPNLSCLLIRNHVKDGMEMADEAGLPDPVRDAIAQHQGTTLISFFYDKALSENPGGKLKESDFRYGGPKPQTIETAIIMLADSIEAASRSLPSHGYGEIQLLVRKVINDKFMDGQFEECNLTLKELHILSDCFASSLASLLHRRVSYPSTAPSEKESREAHQRPESGKGAGQKAAAAVDR